MAACTHTPLFRRGAWTRTFWISHQCKLLSRRNRLNIICRVSRRCLSSLRTFSSEGPGSLLCTLPVHTRSIRPFTNPAPNYGDGDWKRSRYMTHPGSTVLLILKSKYTNTELQTTKNDTYNKAGHKLNCTLVVFWGSGKYSLMHKDYMVVK